MYLKKSILPTKTVRECVKMQNFNKSPSPIKKSRWIQIYRLSYMLGLLLCITYMYFRLHLNMDVVLYYYDFLLHNFRIDIKLRNLLHVFFWYQVLIPFHSLAIIYVSFGLWDIHKKKIFSKTLVSIFSEETYIFEMRNAECKKGVPIKFWPPLDQYPWRWI